uniref:Uncharacterized protein n=1 Tax=Cucumis melo TaxID=3656 RepID=A0A9I9EL06_CUCME
MTIISIVRRSFGWYQKQSYDRYVQSGQYYTILFWRLVEVFFSFIRKSLRIAYLTTLTYSLLLVIRCHNYFLYLYNIQFPRELQGISNTIGLI